MQDQESSGLIWPESEDADISVTLTVCIHRYLVFVTAWLWVPHFTDEKAGPQHVFAKMTQETGNRRGTGHVCAAASSKGTGFVNSHWSIVALQCLVSFCGTATWLRYGFPSSTAGKESASNAGDPDSIPGLGRSPGEGIGYPLQYTWASQVVQLLENPPAMWEIWVRSLGWEDALEQGKATHSSMLAWRIPWTVSSMGLQRVGHHWATFTF